MALISERYEEGAELGEGGMGKVRRVTDRRLQRQVALKTLRSNLLGDPTFSRRFAREARTAGQLEHPNIPPVHDCGTLSDGSPFYTMRLVDGDNLAQVIARLRAGDPKTHQLFGFTRRLQIVQELCDALHYAHNQGFVHRDIKPENVMLGAYGEVQLVDWGVAREYCPACHTSRETTPGSFVGTPMYSAPECIASEEMDPRSDVYSLGVLLYEFCSLNSPFPGSNGPEVLAAVLGHKHIAAEEHRSPGQSRVPRETSRLIAKAMAFSPADRFPSALALKEALQLVIQGDAPAVCPHTAMKRQLTALGRFWDNHNSPPVVALVYLWMLLPLLAGGYYMIWG